jgi:hypothetical protein
MSSVFRRSGSNASSFRGACDPESIIGNLQETRNKASPLAKDGDKNRDPATLVPLPSSPIDIPPPLPILRVDLGPPAMLSPFAMTNADLAEIKVLQDPTNITTGIPPSFPMNWQDRKFPFHLRRGASCEPQDMCDQQISNEYYHSVLSPVSVDGSFEHRIADPACDSLPHIGQVYSTPRNDNTSEGFAHRPADCDDPFRDSLSSPKLSHDTAILTKTPSATAEQECMDCTDTTACHTREASSPVASAVKPQTQTGAHSICEELLDDPIDALRLPSPVVALKTSSSKRTSTFAEHEKGTASVDKPSASDEAITDAEVFCAQQKYRDILARFEGGLKLEKLELAVTRHVEQNPFIGPMGTPAPITTRGDNLGPTVCSSPSNEDLDASECQKAQKIKGTTELVEESKENRKDSLFEDTKHEIVHSRGPPSPERLVRLPLRPKPTMTKHTSFESTLFKPILDRVAAKHLGVFRPGSDPSLRQKYLPHSAVHTSASVQHFRQPSLDLDDTASDDVGIFERTVEQPSPLHIRKQSNATLIEAVSSPQTPANTSTTQATGNSPTRTPSMGDRQQFDLQRAERNARYNAIHSGESSSTALDDDADILLAEFDNAGPGSRGTTPIRSSGGRGRDKRETSNGLERVMHHTPSPRLACATGSREFSALSKD